MVSSIFLTPQVAEEPPNIHILHCRFIVTPNHTANNSEELERNSKCCCIKNSLSVGKISEFQADPTPETPEISDIAEFVYF